MRPEETKPDEGRRKQDSLLRSFNYAFQGLVSSVRHQRNMRIHLILGLLVLIVSIFLNLSRLQLVVIFVAVALVFITEMINSAIEAVVDLITDEIDPRAKAAKDLAAGAVLIAAVNALVVAYLVLADRLTHVSMDLLTVIRRSPAHLTIVALAVLILAVIALKAFTRKGHASLGWAAFGPRHSRLCRLDRGDVRRGRAAAGHPGELPRRS